jgi:hypothetical protein
MNSQLIDLRRPIFRSRTWVSGAIVVATLVAAACSGDSSPSNPGDQPSSGRGSSSETAPYVETPAPFSTPKAEALPPSAQPIGEGDYGLADVGAGSVKGTWATPGLRCDDEGYLHLDTDGGNFLAGVIKAGDWNCQRAVDEWNKANPSYSAIGVRYTSSSQADTLLIVNDVGGSMTLRVSGAWKVS